MSEEKPVFKVTDRRLFNPDGSPRDIEREERAPETAATTATTPVSAAPPLTDAATPTTAAPRLANAETAAGDSIETNPLFIELMMFAAENAAAMLSGHPQFGGEVNLPYAKQFIDMLGALQEKTLGRLSLEEQNTLDALLGQLRMQYVSVTKAHSASPASASGGITGGDITGGR